MLKKTIIPLLSATILLLSSCSNSYNALFRTQDYDYKYEAAKQCYAAGKYVQCYQLLDELVRMLKGSDRAEESLFMLGMCHFNLRDYETAALYFERYYKTYPKGEYTELARYYNGRASFLQSPDPRLDQTPTYTAINALQDFLDYYPYSERRNEVNDMIYQLQDRLVQKEYAAAKLYYNLGSYIGNSLHGGSNYEACIVTAENALKTYPYTVLREDLYMLILRARYKLALNSVDAKMSERYSQTVDEYFGFRNEFPDSKYIKEADNIYRHASAHVK
ncbi:MAG: outer membrane protein assembly factor BamD [Bacteroidaceae bacterium]|nr:outer membrane protein assembly factor BamD [Bacteroidaceae bacterium]